jgi:hypothetical protein
MTRHFRWNNKAKMSTDVIRTDCGERRTATHHILVTASEVSVTTKFETTFAHTSYKTWVCMKDSGSKVCSQSRLKEWSTLKLSRYAMHMPRGRENTDPTHLSATRWGGSASRPGAFYPRERTPVPIVQEAWWAPEPM